MSLGNNNMSNKRRSSKVVWVIIGVFLFVLVVFPYFGTNFSYLISLSLSPLQNIGKYSLIFGALILIGGLFMKKSKAIMVGIVLLLIGLFLGEPLNFLSLFTGGSPNRGYHFFS